MALGKAGWSKRNWEGSPDILQPEDLVNDQLDVSLQGTHPHHATAVTVERCLSVPKQTLLYREDIWYI